MMPGITANLTSPAFVIWESIPKKERKPPNSMGGPRWKGRSAWLSSVIIEHAGWEERYKALKENESEELRSLTKLYIQRGTQLETMTKARDKLQAIVLELTG